MRRSALSLLLLLLSTCQSPAREVKPPSHEHSLLESAQPWQAEVVLDVAPTGVWCVKSFDVFPQYAEPELVALDDLGRLWVLVSYGGRWTPFATGADGTWLGIAAQADLDPRVAGNEIYAGAESGRIWEVVAHKEGVIDNRLISWIEGRAVHALAAGEFDPEHEGQELLAFTEPAEIWKLVPHPPERDGFAKERVAVLSGRIRDAVVLDTRAERERGDTALSDRVLLASRAGELLLLRSLPDAQENTRAAALEVLAKGPQGIGRIALAPESTSLAGRLYFTREDGTIWRMQWQEGVFGAAERIYLGPRGPRGIAAGRFSADPNRECIAIFGYSQKVELLTSPTSGQGLWQAETIFTDTDKGHWLSTCELDGRNGTDELVLSGYSGRVVLLSRPVGFALH